MKSEYFKSQSSQFTGIREKEPPESMNWDRIVYLSLLFIAVVSLLYFLFNYTMVLKGQGRVYANRHTVRLPVDVRILDMYVDEGDAVTENDSLFTFIESVQPESPIKSREDQRRMEEKMVELNNDIYAKQAEIRRANEELDYYRDQKELIKREIKLDLSSVRDLRNIEQKILAIESDKTVDAERLNAFYRQKSMVKKWQEEDQVPISVAGYNRGTEGIGGQGEMSRDLRPQTYMSPVPGVIERIEKSTSELAMRSESVLTIRRKVPDIFIQVIFPRKSLKEIEEGDTMDVKFDNGVSSEGRITGFYTPQISNWDVVGISEYELNDYVVLRLKPLDAEGSATWEENSNLGVTVSKIVF